MVSLPLKIMMSLLSNVFFLATIKSVWIMANGFMDNSPGCFDSCSDQINCTISPHSGFCGAGASSNSSQGPDIAAEPVDLKVLRSEDEEHQYVNLSWRPPEDGSYNYLTGFLVQVTVINLDPIQTGVTGTSCYRVVPASNWFQIHRSLHRKGGVVFFMNCLRIPVQASMDLVISIHSLPLKLESPKLAMTKVTIEPADAKMWNPRFDKWADSKDVMHLVIKNPLPEAKFYAVQIKSVEKDKMVFSHVFHASHDNRTQDELVLFTKDGRPHFLIHGLSKEDNYSILMDVLDGNRTGLAHMRSIQTNPFKLNFTNLPVITSERATHGLDNSLIIIVSVSVVVVVAVVVCLVWKGIFRPSKLRNFVRTLRNGNNGDHNTFFQPIYCYENDNFVLAVENHVLLLRRYLEMMPSGKTNPQAGISLCCSNTDDKSKVRTKNKDSDTIIYLSPRLGEILKFDQMSSMQCSRLDTLCLQALLSLSECRRNGQGAVPVVVTFDCFKQAELAYLDDLMELIFPPHLGVPSEMPTPVRLASLNQDGWKIENLDLVYFRLSRQEDLAQSTPLCLNGWRESEEAKAVERHLSCLGRSEARGYDEITLSWGRHKYSSSQSLECVHYSNNINRSHDRLASSFADRLDKGQEDCEFINSREDLKFSPNTPLIFNTNGFQNLHELRSSDNITKGSAHPNNCVKSPALRYHVELPTPGMITKDASNYQPSYLHSPSELRSYHPKESDEASECMLNVEGQRGVHKEGVVSYKPNVYGKVIDNDDSSSVHSLDSDSLLRTNDLNGYVRRQDQFSNEALHDPECTIQKGGFKLSEQAKDIIVPPSLSQSTFTSLESVCERINRVNEHSGWGHVNMSK